MLVGQSVPRDGRCALSAHRRDDGEPRVSAVRRSVVGEDVVWNRNGRACGRERADAIWRELVVEDDVVVVEADVAFPLLRCTVDLERARRVVVGRREAAVLHATVAKDDELRVLGVLPLLRLAGAREVVGAVARVRERGEVRLHVRIPVGIESRGDVVRIEVVVRVREDVRADFGWRNERLRVERVVHDARRVHVGVRVLREVFSADAWDGADAVDETWGWVDAVVVERKGDEALVDLLELRRILHALGGGASLTESGEEDREEEGDDAHDDEQLDEREAAAAAMAGVLLHISAPKLVSENDFESERTSSDGFKQSEMCVRE